MTEAEEDEWKDNREEEEAEDQEEGAEGPEELSEEQVSAGKQDEIQKMERFQVFEVVDRKEAGPEKYTIATRWDIRGNVVGGGRRWGRGWASRWRGAGVSRAGQSCGQARRQASESSM